MACWVSAMINALGKHVFRRFFSRVQAFLKATVIRRCLKQELGGGGDDKNIEHSKNIRRGAW